MPDFSASSLLLAFLVSFLLTGAMGFFTSDRKRFDPSGKHCYVVGASQGLGLGLAKKLARMGASVSIVSRNRAKIDDGLGEVEKCRVNDSQKFTALAYDVSDPQEAVKAFDDVEGVFGSAPDYVFCTAGVSVPRFFADSSKEELEMHFKTNTFTALWTAHEAIRRWVAQKKEGKIMFTASVVALNPFAGYAAYAPTKYAIRGLCDTLRHELKIYSPPITAHCYFAGTILGPSFEEEKKVRPPLVAKVEGPDSGLTADQCAEMVVRGMEKGHTYITDSAIPGELFRNSQGGLTPRNNFVLDTLWGIAAWIAFPIWRYFIDQDAISEGKKMRAAAASGSSSVAK
ncbi:NAD(P)-binding protein [Atractiella rhizophila]|nr:NAD(P)-binding protein [Atractiella rhizophila]